MKTALLLATVFSFHLLGAFRGASEVAVEASARGPAGMRITASSATLTVDDGGEDISFTVPLDSFRTGIGLRDRHMLGALESDKYPDVKLVLHDADLRSPGAGTATGRLTLHGQTREVVVKYIASDSSGAVSVRASFSVDFGDFGVKMPSYLGVTVKPEVEVVAKARLDR